MPNWSYNYISVKGSKEQVVNWLNMGLKNHHTKIRVKKEMSIDEIKEKISALKRELTLDNFNPMPQTFQDWDTTNSMETYYSWLMGGWNNEYKKYSPHLDNKETYEKVKAHIYKEDYNNNDLDNAAKELYPQYIEDYQKYCAEYQAAKEYQEKTYGVVGWYDWGVTYRGTKWNAKLTPSWAWEEDTENNEILIHFYCETAWSLPESWLHKMQNDWEDKGLNFFVRAKEEAGFYNGYGHAGSSCFEYNTNTYEEAKNKVLEENPELEEDTDIFNESVWEMEEELNEDIDADYIEYIINY